MLIHLFIENLMLIENATISFDSAFVTITGESGSGKSSLMEALKLALGAKSSEQLLRRGQSRGRVRASFDLSHLDPLTSGRLEKLFHDAGLPWHPQEPLIIQRELFSARPSKAFVGSMPITQALLARIGQELVEVVDAGASFTLESLEAHQECLDAFAGLEPLREQVGQLWQRCQGSKEEICRLQSLLERHDQQRELLCFQIDEIEEQKPHPGEEEELMEQFRRLGSREQLLETLKALQLELAAPCLSKLGRYLHQLERHDWNLLTGLLDSLRGCLVQATEAANQAERLQELLIQEPHDSEQIHRRLDQIQTLKKKYGATQEQIEAFLQKAKEQLAELNGAQARLDQLEQQLQPLQQALQESSNQLCAARKTWARELAARLTQVLHELNMPHAQFEVQVTPKAPGISGHDSVEFFLCPNPGEPLLSVRRFASGGEMARLFLALKTLKAHTRIPPTLIFDEIDASIGGTSAARLGDKLQALSSSRQILCITHFPQVAEKAEQHLMIKKEISEDRTRTQVIALETAQQRRSELQRMLGRSCSSDSKV